MVANAWFDEEGRLRKVDIKVSGPRSEELPGLYREMYNTTIEPLGHKAPRVEINNGSGNVYIGVIAEHIEAINSTIAAVMHSGDQQLATALKEIEKAVLVEPGIDDDQRRALLENVADLADAAEAPPEQRKKGRIRAALSYLTATATAGGEIAKAVEAWEPVISGLTQ